MLWEPVYIVVLAAVDILFTYVLLNKVVGLGKKQSVAESAEGNPVVRYAWKRWGIHKGTRIAALYSVSAITVVIFYLSKRYAVDGFRNVLYFIMGAYSLMLLMHVANFRFLVRQEGIVNGKRKRS